MTKPYVLTAEFAFFPRATNSGAPSVSQTNNIEFTDPCIETFTFASTEQDSPGSDNYSGSEIVFNLTPFTITPTICEVEYYCTNVVRKYDVLSESDISCSDLTNDASMRLIDGKLTFSINTDDYQNRVVSPDDYEVTITGKAVTSGQTDVATFVISLVDPCDPPDSIVSPGLTNQVYTITDANASPYMHPEFISDPVYCPIDYTYSETELSAGDSAISTLARTTEFFYGKDLEPLG